MFKKQELGKDAETIIGSSVRVDGDFTGEGNVVVYGIVAGNLSTKQSVHVFEKAQILANISAENAIIAGEVQGNIVAANHLELHSPARVQGDIECQSLSIETGAVFNGKCKMAKEQQSKS